VNLIQYATKAIKEKPIMLVPMAIAQAAAFIGSIVFILLGLFGVLYADPLEGDAAVVMILSIVGIILFFAVLIVFSTYLYGSLAGMVIRYEKGEELGWNQLKEDGKRHFWLTFKYGSVAVLFYLAFYAVLGLVWWMIFLSEASLVVILVAILFFLGSFYLGMVFTMAYMVTIEEGVILSSIKRTFRMPLSVYKETVIMIALIFIVSVVAGVVGVVFPPLSSVIQIAVAVVSTPMMLIILYKHYMEQKTKTEG
jgi:MFS family permease